MPWTDLLSLALPIPGNEQLPCQTVAAVGRCGDSLRRHAAEPNIHARSLQGAVRCLLRPHDGNMRANTQLADIPRSVSADRGVGSDDDLLLTALIRDGEHLPIDAGDRCIHGAVGHGRTGTIPGPEALAKAALRRRKDRHLNRFLAAVGLGHGADADKVANLDVRECRGLYAKYLSLVGQLDRNVGGIVALDRQGRAIDFGDHAADRLGRLPECRTGSERSNRQGDGGQAIDCHFTLLTSPSWCFHACHIGGAAPSRPILMAGAMIVPSGIFCPAITIICAPGLMSLALPGTNLTIGVFGGTMTFFSPSVYLTVKTWPSTLETVDWT